MSAQLPIETEYRDTKHRETKYREAPPPRRDREDVLRVLRQLMAQGVRVVRLGGRLRRAAGDAARRPPAAR